MCVILKKNLSRFQETILDNNLGFRLNKQNTALTSPNGLNSCVRQYLFSCLKCCITHFVVLLSLSFFFAACSSFLPQHSYKIVSMQNYSLIKHGTLIYTSISLSNTSQKKKKLEKYWAQRESSSTNQEVHLWAQSSQFKNHATSKYFIYYLNTWHPCTVQEKEINPITGASMTNLNAIHLVLYQRIEGLKHTFLSGEISSPEISIQNKYIRKKNSLQDTKFDNFF